MKTLEQWQKTMKWSFRLTFGFFLIYGLGVVLKAPIAFNKIKDVLPEEMRKNFIEMALVAPLFASLLFFVVCFVLLRVGFLIFGAFSRSPQESA